MREVEVVLGWTSGFRDQALSITRESATNGEGWLLALMPVYIVELSTSLLLTSEIKLKMTISVHAAYAINLKIRTL
jgi:hypothetical protein